MTNERFVKLYRIDGEQAVDIPPEFELPCEEVVIRKQGERLIIEPKKNSQPDAD